MDKKMEHKHGGNPHSDFYRFGLSRKPVLDLSVNLNPLGPPEIIRSHWPELYNLIKDYPSVEGYGIVDYYQTRFGIPRENILAANGSTEMIYLVPRVLSINNAAIFTPSFYDYQRASLACGANVSTYPLSAENDFAFPETHQIGEIVKKADALWIGRPNNPTGALISKRAVLDLADMFPDKYFLIDEAFIQFVEGWGEKSLLFEAPRHNILVIHSLTKFYALAGLRMGAIVGDKDVIARLNEAKEPWTVNNLADKVAPLLINCTVYEDQTFSLVAGERKRVYERLQEMDGVHPFPCTANFILCRWKGTGGLDHVIRNLLEKGIYVRDCRNFTGLESDFFRFGLGTKEDNDRLLHLLEKL
ncbi:MAG: threonine-phosphate decarboxylase [Deltaproteobacteria bacterium]|nr:threonine-phosphate decarboxylase [Deltaproteobacteria bacterium]